MKMTNKTKYRTDDLRAFMYWVARQQEYSTTYTKNLRVKVIPARKYHSGWARLNVGSFLIRIPGPDKLCKHKLAAVVAHEMRHNHQRPDVHYKPYSTERAMRGEGRYSMYECKKHWPEADALPLRFEGGDKPVAKPRKTSEKVLLRRAISANITWQLQGHGRLKWEAQVQTYNPYQESGLRHPCFDNETEDWDGDMCDLAEVRKIALPGESIDLSGYDEGGWGGSYIEITIPSLPMLMAQVRIAQSKQEAA